MATIIREVTAEIRNLEFDFITPVNIMVKGEIVKQISYVSNADLVRHQNAIVPFTVTFGLLGLIPEMGLKIDAEIIHISPHLINNGSQAEAQIIIQISVTPEYGALPVAKQFLVTSIDIFEDDEPAPKPLANTTELSQYAPETIPTTDEETGNTGLTSSEPGLSIADAFCTKDERHLASIEPEIVPLPDYIMLLDKKVRQMEAQLRWDLEESLRREMQAELEYELSIKLEAEKERLREEFYRAELEKQQEKARISEEMQKKSILQSIYGYKTRYVG